MAGAGVFYGAATTEAQAVAGKPVFVVGGGNSAGQAALHLAKYARQVTILVRSDTLAGSMSQYLIREIGHAANIDVRYRTTARQPRATGTACIVPWPMPPSPRPAAARAPPVLR